MFTPTVDNTEDVLDSRDVIKRFEELESIREIAQDDPEATFDDLEEWEGVAEEHAALAALIEAAEGSPDWSYGETLIRESYFEDYCKEIAYDCGMVDAEATISNYIDWERWAGDCKMGYTEVDFDGVAYLIGS